MTSKVPGFLLQLRLDTGPGEETTIATQSHCLEESSWIPFAPTARKVSYKQKKPCYPVSLHLAGRCDLSHQLNRHPHCRGRVGYSSEGSCLANNLKPVCFSIQKKRFSYFILKLTRELSQLPFFFFFTCLIFTSDLFEHL